MRKMILAALVVMVYAWAWGQAQSADPTPTPFWGLTDLTAIAARQTAAARPPAVSPSPDVPINIPAPERDAVGKTDADPEDVGGGAPQGVGDAPERPNPSPTGRWRFPVFDATPDPNASPTPFWGLADLTAIAARQTAVAGGAAGPGDGAPPSPLEQIDEQTGEQTGAVHTVGEGLLDVDAAATALHQMVHSPAAAPAFRSICDLPARGPADAVACELFKAAYRLRHGNPCRHNDEGEAICLH